MLYAHMVRRHDNCFGVSFGICAHPPRQPATSNMECASLDVTCETSSRPKALRLETTGMLVRRATRTAVVPPPLSWVARCSRGLCTSYKVRTSQLTNHPYSSSKAAGRECSQVAERSIEAVLSNTPPAPWARRPVPGIQWSAGEAYRGRLHVWAKWPPLPPGAAAAHWPSGCGTGCLASCELVRVTLGPGLRARVAPYRSWAIKEARGTVAQALTEPRLSLKDGERKIPPLISFTKPAHQLNSGANI